MTAPARQWRVLVVDDSEEFLAAACLWVGIEPSLRLAGTARNGVEALAAVDAVAPDLVLMDAEMPGVDGFEATRRIKTRPGAPLVVMLSVHEGQTIAREAWAAGADAFLPKEEFAVRLLPTLKQLREDGSPLHSPGHEGTPSPRPKTARAGDDGPAGR